ncbi:MAG: CDP-alcohol phosphatidyltransferase family protein [Alphaproteobacteria bacterium]|nr:CDP-alcohol phosphatidyltransferase family protein [Alphaproteobacteria bacterium]MBF0251216.1 CDP-alcohol phosphatidyltransferase family protein [Alphaproteobacteria bacterium]
MNIPNWISMARVATVPVVVWLILEGHLSWAFWVFGLAGVSDALDGFIAKRFAMETELGRYLDPIADKALLSSTYVSMAVVGMLPSWLAILVVFRDLFIVGGAMLYETLTHSLTMRTLWVSKLNTVMQILLVAVVLGQAMTDASLGALADVMIFAAAATTLVSGLAYALVWGRQWSDGGAGR